MHKKKKFFKTAPFIIAIVIVLLASGTTFAIYQSRQAPDKETVQVNLGTVTETVFITGTTKPAISADLAFELAGKISEIPVAIGDVVLQGTILARLSQSGLLASIEEAKANVEAEKALLADYERGPTTSEIKIEQLKVLNAENMVQENQQELVDAMSDAYTKADDAVRGKADQLFSNPKTNPNFKYDSPYQQLESQLESDRANLEDVFTFWLSENIALTSDKDIKNIAAQTSLRLQQVKNFLDTLSFIVNSLISNSTLTQTTLDSHKTDVATARTNVNAAITNTSTARTNLQDAEISLILAEEQLTLLLEGKTTEEIAVQAAKVKQAEAKLISAQANLEKSLIRAPFAGVITARNAEPGEIAAANTPIISLITQNGLEIESKIPEIDIGRIAINNPVEIVFDAFPSETFQGVVRAIDPAETIVDGVVNFKVTITVIDPDPRLKTGLTANLIITTKEKSGILTIPQAALIERSNGTFVEKIVGETATETPIITGIRSRDGMIEVLSGVSVGDTLILN